MVKMRFREGRITAVFVCDICGKQIEDRMGTAVANDNPTDGEFGDVLYAHKGACDKEAEKRMGGASSGWQELSHHVLFLAGSIGMSGSSLTDLETQLNEIGFGAIES